MKKVTALLLILASAVAIPVAASAAAPAAIETAAADSGQKMAATGSMSEGEVKKIDKDAAKVTIKHGPLANLDMPGMTMVFRVKDAAMLDQVKVGDKIKFKAEKLNGALTVTAIETAK